LPDGDIGITDIPKAALKNQKNKNSITAVIKENGFSPFINLTLV